MESASCAEPVKKPVKEGTLSVEVKELRAEIEALKKELTPSKQKEKSRGVRGCRACREANPRTCDHCWRCGSADHYQPGADNDYRETDRVIPRGTGLTQAEEVLNHREDTKEQCCLCGQRRSGLFECSKCEVSKYCSVKCQADHWKVQQTFM